MTWFTDSPYEKMMTQKPNGRRDTASPVPVSPACESCSYKGLAPCVGCCMKKLQGKNGAPEHERRKFD